MERIPILKVGDCLLVTIQVDMHDQLAMTLQEDLTNQIARHESRGVLIDISALEIVDSFITGMQPAVAITLVELGLTLPGIKTSLNVERGLELLREHIQRDDEAVGAGT